MVGCLKKYLFLKWKCSEQSSKVIRFSRNAIELVCQYKAFVLSNCNKPYSMIYLLSYIKIVLWFVLKQFVFQADCIPGHMWLFCVARTKCMDTETNCYSTLMMPRYVSNHERTQCNTHAHTESLYAHRHKYTLSKIPMQIQLVDYTLYQGWVSSITFYSNQRVVWQLLYL